jgi:hypothetical protein
MTAAYPLTWPDHIPRAPRREAGRFNTTPAKALANVEGSLRRFASDSGKALSGVVISSNYSLGDRKPGDPGVAVWFVWDQMQVCIPVDRYTTVEANLQAIHHVIEARRTELRHGTLALVRASFAGFRALPPPADTPAKKPWPEVLGVAPNASREAIEAAYRSKAKQAHPDAGGSGTEMMALNEARAAALRDRQ